MYNEPVSLVINQELWLGQFCAPKGYIILCVGEKDQNSQDTFEENSNKRCILC